MSNIPAPPEGFTVEVTGAEAWRTEIEDAAKRHGVDPDLIGLVIDHESRGNEKAVSPKGAQGLGQLMPGTARMLGVKNAFDPTQNIDGSAKLLKSLLDKYKGNVRLALGAYNAGEGAVDRYGDVPPYKETLNYVKDILPRYKAIKAVPEGFTATGVMPKAPAGFTEEVSAQDVPAPPPGFTEEIEDVQPAQSMAPPQPVIPGLPADPIEMMRMGTTARPVAEPGSLPSQQASDQVAGLMGVGETPESGPTSSRFSSFAVQQPEQRLSRQAMMAPPDVAAAIGRDTSVPFSDQEATPTARTDVWPGINAQRRAALPMGKEATNVPPERFAELEAMSTMRGTSEEGMSPELPKAAAPAFKEAERPYSMAGAEYQLAEGAKDTLRSPITGVRATIEGLERASRAFMHTPTDAPKGFERARGQYNYERVKFQRDLRHAATRLARIEKQLEGDPQRVETAGFLEDVVEQMPQSVKMLTTGLLFGPAAGAVGMGLEIMGGTYKELIDKKVDPDRALLASVLNASAQAPLEYISLGKLLDTFQPGRSAAKKVLDIFGAMGTEFTTETLQSLPESASKIWAEHEEQSNVQKLVQFLNELPVTLKQGMFEGLVVSFTAGVGGVGGALVSPSAVKAPIAEPAPASGTPPPAETPPIVPPAPPVEVAPVAQAPAAEAPVTPPPAAAPATTAPWLIDVPEAQPEATEPVIPPPPAGFTEEVEVEPATQPERQTTYKTLNQEVIDHKGTGGISSEAKDSGFAPGFIDRDTGAVYPSMNADGKPAGIHLLDGIPEGLVTKRDQDGDVVAVKGSIEAGFIKDGKFYTREEAAAQVTKEPTPEQKGTPDELRTETGAGTESNQGAGGKPDETVGISSVPAVAEKEGAVETKEEPGAKDKKIAKPTSKSKGAPNEKGIVPNAEGEATTEGQEANAGDEGAAAREQEGAQEVTPVVEATAAVAEPVEEAKGEPKAESQVHDFSSTQVDLPKEHATAIKEFGKQISDEEIYIDPKDPSYGREDSPHVTVKYGLHTADAQEVKPLIEGVGPIKAKLGKVSIFESDNYDVVKADIESPQLHELNKKIAENTKVTDTYPEYKPHVTIAYVKKGKGKKYVGNNAFEGREISFNKLTFSGKDGKKTILDLAEKPARAPKKEGKVGGKATVYTASNKPIETHYELREADSVTASHDAAGNINPDYPSELQPRDRSRAASKLQIQTMAGNLNPERLGVSAQVEGGAPIVGPDGVVESGNGRILAVRMAYEGKGAEPYRKWLVDHAQEFGLNPDDVAGMKSPVLVRVRDSEIDRAEFARQANQGSIASMSPAELARADAARITEDHMGLYNVPEDGNVLAGSNRPFVRKFLETLGKEESAQYQTKEGGATKQLADRIQAAVFEKAYSDERLLSLMAEDADVDIKNVIAALNTAAPEFAKAKAFPSTTEVVGITQAIVEGANLFRQAKSSGVALEELLAQQNMFHRASADGAKLARFFDENKRSGKRMGEGLGDIGRTVNRELQRSQNQELFARPKLTNQDIIDAAIKRTEDIHGSGQEGTQKRFGEVAPGAGSSGWKPSGRGRASSKNAAGTNKALKPTTDKAFSGFPLSELIQEVQNLTTDIDAAMPALVDLGRRAIDSGARTFRSFREKMREWLGKAYDSFRAKMRDVYEQAKAAYAASAVGNERGMVGFQGSPHKFEKHSLDFVGTGEGNAAVGYGHYIADSFGIAKYYRDLTALTSKTWHDDIWEMAIGYADETIADAKDRWEERDPDQPPSFYHYKDTHPFDGTRIKEELLDMAGNAYDPQWNGRSGEKFMNRLVARIESMDAGKFTFADGHVLYDGKPYAQTIEQPGHIYKVDIPEPSDFLQWDKPLLEQSEKVKKALAPARTDRFDLNPEDGTDVENGGVAYARISDVLGSDKAASEYLNSLGIPGHSYPSGMVQGNPHPTKRNYVVYADKHVNIIEMYAGFPVERVVQELQNLTNDLETAMPRLIGLGTRAINEGANTFAEFRRQMKVWLGDSWDAFKGRMREVWDALKKPLANERGAVQLVSSRQSVSELPAGTVLRVLAYDGAASGRGSGEAYLDALGNVILDGERYSVGEKAYLFKDKFYKDPPNELLKLVKERVEQASGRIKGLKETMWQVRWKEPKRITIKAGEEYTDLFGEKEVAEKDFMDVNDKRYEKVTTYNKSHYLHDLENLIDSPSDSKLMDALYDKELQDKHSFQIGGLLHLAEEGKQLTKKQKAAVENYQGNGGSLGMTAIKALERPDLIEGAAIAYPELADQITQPTQKKLKSTTDKEESPDILYSGFPLQEVIREIQALSGDVQAAIPKLVNLGGYAIHQSADTYRAFRDQMKQWLGKSWDAFRSRMRDIYEQAKALAKKATAPLQNERGAITYTTRREAIRAKAALPNKRDLMLAPVETQQGQRYQIVPRVSSEIRIPPKPMAGETAPALTHKAPVSRIYDDLMKAIAPTTRGEVAAFSGRKLSEAESRMTRKMDQFLRHMRRADALVFSRMIEAEALTFMRDMDTTGIQTDPKLQPYADIIKSMFKNRVDAIRSLGTGKLEQVRENYFGRIWTKTLTPDEQMAIEMRVMARRPLAGAGSFLKKRTLGDDVWDDLLAGKDIGLKPISYNPLDLVAIKLHEMDKYYMAHKYMQEMVKQGPAEFVKHRGEETPGFLPIDDRYGTVYRKITDDKGYEHFVVSGHYYAHEQLAEVLNNYLSQTLYQNKYIGKMFTKYMAANNTLNMFQLGLGSMFHVGFTSLDATASQLGLGVKALAEGRIGAAFEYFGTAPFSFVNLAQLGNNILKEWHTPGTTNGIIQQIVEGINLGGGQFGMERSLRTSHIKQAWMDLHKGPIGIVKAVPRSPLAFAEATMLPVMNWYVPRLKAGVFGMHFYDWLASHPNATYTEAAEEARYIWNRVDGRLGQVVYNRTFIRNTVKNFAQAIMRAPGWKAGGMVEIGGTIKDIILLADNAGRTVFNKGILPMLPGAREKLPMHKVRPDRIYWVIGVAILTAVINGLLTKTWTGETPHGKDFLMARTGKKDRYGNDIRFMSPTYVKDYLAYYTHGIVEPVLNATAPLLALARELYRGKDYYGVEFKTKWMPFWDQRWAEIQHYFEAYKPFWKRGQEQIEATGTPVTTRDRIMPFMGFMPSPSRYSMTPAQRMASEIVGDKYGDRTTTKKDFERRKLRTQWEVRIQNTPTLAEKLKDPESAESLELKGHLARGELKASDKEYIKKSAKDSWLERTFRYPNLSTDQMLTVWDRMDPEERKQTYRNMRQVGQSESQDKETQDKFRKALRLWAAESEPGDIPEAYQEGYPGVREENVFESKSQGATK